jgi:hypothetical protein
MYVFVCFTLMQEKYWYSEQINYSPLFKYKLSHKPLKPFDDL